VLPEILYFGIMVSALLSPHIAMGQERFAHNVTATRNALRDGKIAEALAYHEQKAREAEQTALSSASPQAHWETAMVHYREANRAAKLSGEVQKMLAYSEKAFETARNTGTQVTKSMRSRD
jgi:hypothetical protein